MPQLKAEHPISAFALSLLVTAVQCQQSVNCIESELSSPFLTASAEGGTTPIKFIAHLVAGPLGGGNRRQIIWGFNTIDITRTKIYLGGLGIGIICGEEGRKRFPAVWWFCCQSGLEPLTQVKLLRLLPWNFHYRSCSLNSWITELKTNNSYLIYLTLYGRATCVGDRRQIIWGFNTVDITRTKICLGGLGIGLICGEKGRIIFSGFWSINRPSRAQPMSHVRCFVRCTIPSQCNGQSLWCSQFLNAPTESRTPYISLCPKPIGHCSAMSAVSELYWPRVVLSFPKCLNWRRNNSY